jgi:outer membrane lipoprotein-sorting protein
MKRILALIVAVVFALGMATMGFAAEAPKEMKGTVTKVEGAKITFKDDKGKETTVEDKAAKDIKAGDKVMFKDGKVTKEAAKAAAPADKPKKKKVEGC